MSEHYKEDGSVAKIYQVVTGMDSFFSITYKDPHGNRIMQEDFPYKALGYVEDAAENWCKGIKFLTEG